MSSLRFLNLAGLLVLAGCAMTPYSASFQESKYQRSDKTPYANIYWNCTQPSRELLAVEGYMETSFDSRPLWDLTVRLLGINEKGEKVTEARGYGVYSYVTVGRPSPFRALLPLTGAEKRIDLVYSYQYKEDQGDGRRSGSRAFPLFRPAADATFAWTVTDACRHSEEGASAPPSDAPTQPPAGSPSLPPPLPLTLPSPPVRGEGDETTEMRCRVLLRSLLSPLKGERNKVRGFKA